MPEQNSEDQINLPDDLISGEVSGNGQTKYHKKDPLAGFKIEKTKKGFFGFFVTQTRFTLLLIFGIILLGAFALVQIPREADPEVKIPIAVVTTVFPGASPADVENLVTDKIETKIESLNDIKLVTSSSVLGLSSVMVEFDAKADLDDSVRSLKDKILEVTGLPNDAEDPFVTEVRANDFPLITFSLAGHLNDGEFKELGETIQDQLEKIPGVSSAPLLGAQKREFSIVVNQALAERLNISLFQVVNAIAGSNSDTPLGNITIDRTNYNLRTVAKINSLADLRQVVVSTSGGQPVLLSDIAQIKNEFAKKNNLARLSVGGGVPINTISLQLYKETGGNIINIVDEAKEKMEMLKKQGIIPDNVTVEISSDYSSFIRDDLKNLGSSGIFAVVLIFFILFLALSLREAAISLVAIPISFLITFFVINFRGDTLNSLVLFSLVLSLGLLVDAFIIMLEGIFHNIRLGYNSRDAALLAISHYKNPLFSGTFTTIAAFVPMLLVSGILGEFLKVLPLTITTVLLSSLFVSLAIVPTIASVLLKKKGLITSPQKESILERHLTNRLTKWYAEKIDKILISKKTKLKFFGGLVVAFVISLGLIISPLVPVELFPNVDLDFTYINIEMPVGTSLEATNEVAQEVESYLLSRNDIKTFTTSVGSSLIFDLISSGSSGENVASVNVTFVDEKNRDKKSYEMNNEMRKDLRNIKQGKITIQEISSGPPTGAPIEARITGGDLAVIDELSKKLISVMEDFDGIIEIETSKKISPADLTFSLNKDTLARSGLSVSEVSGFLRGAIFGITATVLNIKGEDVDVVVKISESQINSVEQIKNLSIINARGESVKLSRVAEFSLEPALASINHRNFERTQTIQANLEPGFTPAAVVPRIEQALKKENIVPEGYGIVFGGEVEDIEQSFSELWNAMIVAVLLILAILVLQFNSFKKPLNILLTLPMSLIGVVVGILVFRLPFSFSVFLGIISLAGIVVNDAIVLLDKTNRNVKEYNMKPRQAVANAGATRLQPIILTTVTTIAGIFPLIFADEFWFGLSISIMFGIGFATILQLFAVPIMYLKLEGKKDLQKINQLTGQ